MEIALEGNDGKPTLYLNPADAMMLAEHLIRSAREIHGRADAVCSFDMSCPVTKQCVTKAPVTRVVISAQGAMPPGFG